MKNKRIIIVLTLITIISFLNIKTVNAAKETEFICEYESIEYNQNAISNGAKVGTKHTYTIYSGVKNKKATDPLIHNWIEDYEIKYITKLVYKSNNLTIDTDKSEYATKAFKAYFDSNYENPHCPKYLFDYNSGTRVVSDDKNDFKELQSSYGTDLKWGLYENTDIEKKRIAATDSDKYCKEAQKSFSEYKNYDGLCIYYKNSTTPVYLYIANDKTALIRDGKIYYSEKSEEDMYEKMDYNIPKPGTIVNNINGTQSCPARIYCQYVYKSNSSARMHGIACSSFKLESQTRGLDFLNLFHLKVKDFENYVLLTKTKYNASTCEEEEKYNYKFDQKPIDCNSIFGPNSEFRKQLNRILKYIRILVPILIIALGLFDFGKAILASKEDEMKKAQSRFTKRLIIGLVIFLLPTIINVLLNIANTAWKGDFEDSNCGMDIVE